jgi:hypothetical protein
MGATGQGLGDFHQLPLAEGQASEFFIRVDFIGQALEARQRLLAQQPAIDHAETRRQVPEEQVLGDAHFRHQVQLLVDHRDAAGDAVGGAFERHGLLRRSARCRCSECRRHRGSSAGSTCPRRSRPSTRAPAPAGR